MRSTVFIAGDPNMAEILDIAATRLEALGCTVVRGLTPDPGTPFRFSAEQRRDFLAPADVVVVSSRSRLVPEDLDAARRLRGIVFPSIGVDAVDLGECARRGIIVGHSPIPENFLAMSEATVMLMLVLLYGLGKTESLLREHQPRPTRMHARMLKERTIGIIGMGRIGGGVVRRLQGWDARIVVHDPYLSPEQVGAEVELLDKDNLLRRSDVVSLHVPLNAETRHLVGRRELELMKPDAILINTARGGVVDEAALAEVMERGHLAGAALDVLDPEPPPPDHPLRWIDRVILTPHMVGHTSDLYAAIPDAVVENIERILRGSLPLYTKNPEVEPAWRERQAALEAARTG